MSAELITVLLWLAFLGFIAWMPKDKMDMVWLAALGLLLLGPVLAWFFPSLR